MKIRKFLNLFRGVSLDTKIMVVDDWTQIRPDYHPLLGPANTLTQTYDAPQGIGDDGCSIAYLWHDPEKEKQDITLGELREMCKDLPRDTEIMVVVNWKQKDEEGRPLLGPANSTTLIEHELEWDGDDERLIYLWNNPDKELRR